jgi:hypothetical protein
MDIKERAGKWGTDILEVVSEGHLDSADSEVLMGTYDDIMAFIDESGEYTHDAVNSKAKALSNLYLLLREAPNDFMREGLRDTIRVILTGQYGLSPEEAEMNILSAEGGS